MKKIFKLSKVIVPLVIALGMFSGCDEEYTSESGIVKATIVNWPENVKSISVGGSYFEKGETNLQKESESFGSLGIELTYEGYYSGEDKLIGTVKDKTNFKVFVNGIEIQNEADYFEWDYKKMNFSAYFYAQLQDQSQTELTVSFEGAPEEISLEDIRLLDETGYSYIRVDDKLTETIKVSFSYADENETEFIDELFKSYLFGDEANYLYYAKAGKQIKMSASPKNGYSMSGTDGYSFKKSYDDTEESITQGLLDGDYFVSAPFYTLGQSGQICTISGNGAQEIPDTRAGKTYYAARVLARNSYFSAYVKPEINNARISFGADKAVTITADDTEITGTYYMLLDGANYECPGYSGGLYETESIGYFTLTEQKEDGAHYTFFFAPLDASGNGQPAIGLYGTECEISNENEVSVVKGQTAKLNVKFVYFDTVPKTVSLHESGATTDTELSLTSTSTSWDSNVTDAVIEFYTSSYEAGEHHFTVKTDGVESNSLKIVLTEPETE